MIKVYHGSNVVVREPLVGIGRLHDEHTGLYLMSDLYIVDEVIMELRNEARAETKLAWAMLCKDEVDDSQLQNNQEIIKQNI